MALSTISQYVTQLSNAEQTLQTASKSLTDARTELDKTQNPTVFFTPEERAARQEQALPALEQAESDAAKAVEDALTLAGDVVSLTVNAEPALSPSEEAQAAARLTFVRDDVQRLSVKELTVAIRTAALRDDKVSLYLYLREAPSRLKAQASTPGPHDDGDAPWDAIDNDGDARAELQRVLNDVRESFKSPELKRLHDKAVGLRATAFDLDNAVRSRARQNESYAWQSANEVSW